MVSKFTAKNVKTKSHAKIPIIQYFTLEDRVIFVVCCLKNKTCVCKYEHYRELGYFVSAVCSGLDGNIINLNWGSGVTCDIFKDIN